MGKTVRKNTSAFWAFLGVGITAFLCLGLTAGLAQLVLSQKVGEGSAEFWISMILLLATIVGTLLPILFHAKKPASSAIVITLILIIGLFIASLAFRGQLHHILQRAGTVMAGGGVTCLICMKRGNKSLRRRKHYR